jgi:hypothetical protein
LILLLIFCSINIASDSEHDDENDIVGTSENEQVAKKQKINDLELK